MMKFTKMHGLGNDYIYVNCMDGTFGGAESSILESTGRIARLSEQLSDRHTGIGADGLIMILPSEKADFRMRMFNADGSEGKMCGNGVRCIGKYVYDNGLTHETDITLETLSGVKYLKLKVGADGRVERATVDMGAPVLEAQLIPVTTEEGQGIVDIPFATSAGEVKLTAVSMGNPHGVVFVDNLSDVDVHGLGAELESHNAFPERANIEFVEVLAPGELKMRVWERGSGETMACGTGACAVVVAAMLTGRLGGRREATVHLLGGDLHISLDEATGHVLMEGTATTVFTGELEI